MPALPEASPRRACSERGLQLTAHLSPESRAHVFVLWRHDSPICLLEY